MFGYGDLGANVMSHKSSSFKFYLNNFGFESVQCGENLGRWNRPGFVSNLINIYKGEKVLFRNQDNIECPICKKGMSRGDLHGHLKVCNDLQSFIDLQTILDMDGIDLGDKVCEKENVLSTCRM